MEKKIILTDRTRMTTYAECPRKAFWTYYWGGTGIVPEGDALPLLFGSAIHVTIERMLVGKVEVDRAISAGLPFFDPLPEPRRSEQRWLFEGLMRIWIEKRLPELRAEFDFLAVEREFLWTLGEDSSQVVLQMVRPDLLARRISDGELFYIEWKTTGWGDADWAQKWEKNTQVFCNALAIEETFKEPVAGVMIEGLVKGRLKREWRKSSELKGQIIQQSALCYAWELDGELSTKWFYGAKHIPVWTIPGMTPKEWISRLDKDSFLCPVPPIYPDREDQEDWRVGAEEMMFRIDEGLEKIILEKDPKEKRKIASRYFPPNYEACYKYGPENRCGYFEACFSSEVRRNPLGHGFVQRTPHHEAEIKK